MKEGYEYEVIKAEVDEVSGVLELYIKSNFVLHEYKVFTIGIVFHFTRIIHHHSR